MAFSTVSLSYWTTRKHHQHPVHNTVKLRASSSSSSSSQTSSPSSTTSVDDYDLPFGDARGAALLLEDVSVYRGPSQILKNLNWRMEPKTQWALVGANGAGKSTLVKAIMGELPHDGSILMGKPSTSSSSSAGTTSQSPVAYLQQTAVAGSTKTVREEAMAGMTAIEQAKKDLQIAEENGDLDKILQATTQWEAAGGYQQDKIVASVLKGLGFLTDSQLAQPCHELSGGWQMRVALARILLAEPSLCILDEPGNHLDAAAKQWLAQYLKTYQGGLILVTHDVELLASVKNIAEVTMGTLQIYKTCSYAQYLNLKEERAAAAISEFQRNQEKAAKLQAFVDKWGASATKASAAQSRVKQLEKMQQSGLLDAPTESIIAQRFKPTVVLPHPPRVMGDVLLRLTQGSHIGYQPEKPLVELLGDLEITKGMKLLIRGPNGAGKSTVLASLRGTLPLLQGEREENSSLRLGMFTQDLAQELDVTERAIDLVTAYAREGAHGDIFVSDQDARTAMGRLGLQSEKALRKVGDLSGGEKARVALAMFSLKPSNLYLLDEVSNHLDVECIEALGDALREWGDDHGAVVVVSHDRAFCEQLEFTHVATVDNGSLSMEFRGARPSDFEISSLSSPSVSSSSSSLSSSETSLSEDEESSSSSSNPEFDPSLRKKAYNAPKRITKLESLIETAELKISSLEEEMLANGSDVGKLVDLTKKKEELEEQVMEYMEEWEELEALLAQIS